MPPVYPAGSYPALVVADGAVAYWRLNEASGLTAVDVIGAKNGTIAGGVTLGQPGALADGDSAMAFNAVGSQITCGAVSLPATCSIEVWLKTVIQSEMVTVQNRISDTTAHFYLTCKSGKAFAWCAGSSVTGVKAIADGQYHQWTTVFSATQLWVYVDGVLDNGPVTLTHAASNAAITIGQWANAYRFNGLLDDIALYPTALTAPQIAAHYAARTWAPTPPAFTSPAATTFTVGTPGTFTVTATGTLPLTLSVSGPLPAGVTFTDHGNGTGTLGGTPTGTGAVYPLTFTATNSAGPVTQPFTLTVLTESVPTGPPRFALQYRWCRYVQRPHRYSR
jgi:Concanavalin A-like lectin/glucanases superfamily